MRFLSKVVSIIFAISITIYSVQSFRRTYTINYTIQVRALPSDIILSSLGSDVVRADYSCSFIVSDTDFVRNRDRTLIVEFSHSLFPMTNLNVERLIQDKHPFCKLENVSPKFIILEFERLISKRMKVVPDVIGRVPDIFSYSVTVYPDEVNVTGPESVLRGRESIFTEVVDIQGRSETFSIIVPISKIDGRIEVIPETVEVTVNITRR